MGWGRQAEKAHLYTAYLPNAMHLPVLPLYLPMGFGFVCYYLLFCHYCFPHLA